MVVIQSGKKRKNIKRKEKFIKCNGGLLLQQQLSSSEVVIPQFDWLCDVCGCVMSPTSGIY